MTASYVLLLVRMLLNFSRFDAAVAMGCHKKKPLSLFTLCWQMSEGPLSSALRCSFLQRNVAMLLLDATSSKVAADLIAVNWNNSKLLVWCCTVPMRGTLLYLNVSFSTYTLCKDTVSGLTEEGDLFSIESVTDGAAAHVSQRPEQPE